MLNVSWGGSRAALRQTVDTQVKRDVGTSHCDVGTSHSGFSSLQQISSSFFAAFELVEEDEPGGQFNHNVDNNKNKT